MHTFHDEFEVTKLIGKGHFAKVYYAINKEKKKAFAIKAFNKEALLSQKNGKVYFYLFVIIIQNRHLFIKKIYVKKKIQGKYICFIKKKLS
jgi:serine/threonine protein kinase